MRAGLVTALLAAMLAAGCGGDDGGDGGSSATDWANDLCSTITEWTESVEATSNSLRGGNLSEESLRDAADEFRSATQQFVDDVRGLGAPDTDAGEEAKEEIDQLADAIDEDVAEIEEAVEGGEGLAATVSAVTTALAGMGEELASTFTALEQLDAGSELEEAFRDADACDELSNQGS
jgi:methyl-accepting chemotaxis protein